MEAYDLDLPEFNGPVEGTRPTSISGKVDTPATPARGKGRKNKTKKEDTPSIILSGPPPSGNCSPGDFACVEGLRIRSDLNGKVGIVVAAPQEGSHGCRVQVQLNQGGKRVLVRRTNLKPARDTEWGVGEHGWSLVEMSRHTRIGNISPCDEYARKLWEQVPEVPPSTPQLLEPGWRKSLLSSDPDGHKLFWLGLDAMCHHLVLEKRDTRWRLLQSYIKPDPRRDCGELPSVGYSAYEWCTPGSPGMGSVAPYTRYGGGQTFGTDDAAILLDAIQEFQGNMELLLKNELVGQVLYPPRPEDLEHGWGESIGIPSLDLLELEQREAVQRWAYLRLNAVERGVEGVTIVGLTDQGNVGDSGLAISMAVSGEHLFYISPQGAAPLDRCHRHITGMRLTGLLFLRMLFYMNWKKQMYFTADGWRVAGITIRCADLGRQGT